MLAMINYLNSLLCIVVICENNFFEIYCKFFQTCVYVCMCVYVCYVKLIYKYIPIIRSFSQVNKIYLICSNNFLLR